MVFTPSSTLSTKLRLMSWLLFTGLVSSFHFQGVPRGLNFTSHYKSLHERPQTAKMSKKYFLKFSKANKNKKAVLKIDCCKNFFIMNLPF